MQSPDTHAKVAGSRLSTLGSRLVIVGMLLLAVAASVAAVLYLRGLSHRSMTFWGPATGELILQAPQVEALQLAPAESTAAPASAERLTSGGQSFDVIQRRDVSLARGLSNVRRGLMQDASYQWPALPATTPAHWSYALRFRNADRSATLLFALDPPVAAQLDDAERVSTLPIAAGLRSFSAEQFSSQKVPSSVKDK